MRQQGATALLAWVLLAGAPLGACSATPVGVAPPPAPSPATSPTLSPCAYALAKATVYNQRLVDAIAPLRSASLAQPPDRAAMLDRLRDASSALRTASAWVSTEAGRCSALDRVRGDLAKLYDDVAVQVRRGLDHGPANSQVLRLAGVELVSLLGRFVGVGEQLQAIVAGLGIDVAVLQVPRAALAPMPPLSTATPVPAARATPVSTPRPTPAPRPPQIKTVGASSFGSSVRVSTYWVKGSTPQAILRSIDARGPLSRWTGGRATGQTRMSMDYRFVLVTDPSGECRIVAEAKPAIKLSYAIVLPRWRPPSSPSAATVRWWNEALVSIAAHEKVHVSIYRAAARRANAVVASSTCANVARRLRRVWNRANRDNCEFDMREYGSAMGLSLKACLAP